MSEAADTDKTAAQPPFTGRVRRRRTKLSVKAGDVAARSLITLGGLGTIVAVMGVCLFLLWEAIPLFQGAQVHSRATHPDPAQADVAHLATDDHQAIGYVLQRDGVINVFACETGESVARYEPFGEREMTAWSFGEDGGDAVFGFADGSVQMGRLTFETQFLEAEDVPEEIRALDVNEPTAYEEGIVTRTPVGQFRLRTLNIELNEPTQLDDPSAVLRLSHTKSSGRTLFVSYLRDGRLLLNEVHERRNLLTGEVRTELRDRALPFTLPEGREAPDHVLMAGLGDNIFVVWNDGRLLRYDLRNREDPKVVEAVSLVEEDERLTAVDFMVGRHSLVTGDSRGRVRVWFRVPEEQADAVEAAGQAATAESADAADLGADDADANEGDGQRLVRAHELAPPESQPAVTALGRSSGSRMMSIGYADGTLRLYHVTANNVLLEPRTGAGETAAAPHRLYIPPRDDGLFALSENGMHRWRFDRKHPAVTWQSAFTPVWYEDYARPAHMWQSSAGTDDFEPKYGLVPLIFGTLKATFYSMLFGLPIALLAAIYTSEFLHRSVRARIKPVIEMMASLPSVVLGFVAALVLAPIVEQVVPATLAAFAIVPFVVLLCGYFWQAMPQQWQMRLTHWRVLFIGLAVLGGAGLSIAMGGVVEWAVFSGDIREWLRGERGSGMTGWVVLLLPVCIVATALLLSGFVNPAVRDAAAGMTRTRAAGVELARFLGGTAVTLLLAVVGAALLTYAFGWDPRGRLTMGGMDFSPIDGYEQRNALIVGFVMGFAIIPIIYTIAEDALSAVPEHLRSASLGAGATAWQTATRLIVPTAMSGLFSAAMIGLGRAAGETMIVLMAAGNTPLMEMNIFNGFRTLSANIAVELPEASVGGTHYRMLFLAALTLFAMTFAVNTVAEVVRLRFRKRAYQL